MYSRLFPVSLIAAALVAGVMSGCGDSSSNNDNSSSSSMAASTSSTVSSTSSMASSDMSSTSSEASVSSSSSSTTAMGFMGKTFNDGEDEVLIDTVNMKTWVNDVDACFAAIVATDTTLCAELDFAGATDWRYPTTQELADLFTRVKADNDTMLNYIVSTCAVGTASDGHVYTENAANTGEVLGFEPGNAGLRCVRDGEL